MAQTGMFFISSMQYIFTGIIEIQHCQVNMPLIDLHHCTL